MATVIDSQQIKKILSFLKQVVVTPSPSSDYILTPLSGDPHTCLCANERKTLKWNMEPTVLGEGLH